MAQVVDCLSTNQKALSSNPRTTTKKKKKKKKFDETTLKFLISTQVWWHMHVIPALGKERQEDCELEVSLGYTANSCLKKKNT
jgi:hypothetical protein